MIPLIILAIVVTGIVIVVRKTKKPVKGVLYQYSPDKKPKGNGKDIDKEEDYTEN